MKLTSQIRFISILSILMAMSACTKATSFSRIPIGGKEKVESPNNEDSKNPKNEISVALPEPEKDPNPNFTEIEKIQPKVITELPTEKKDIELVAPTEKFTFENESFDAIQIEKQTIKEPTKVDLLWVIDNSQSMVDNQRKLAQAFKAFSDKYLKADRDIRIARITTDAYKAGSTTLSGCKGEPKKSFCDIRNAQLIKGWADGSNPPVPGRTRSGTPILTNIQDQSFLGTHDEWILKLNKDFATNVKVNVTNKEGQLLNVGSSDERSMQSLWNFIEINEQTSHSFFRKGSYRGIIFVSDEVDSSMFTGAPKGAVDQDEVVSYNSEYLKKYLDQFYTKLDQSDQKSANYFVTSIATTTPPKGIDCAHKDDLIAQERSFCNASKAHEKLTQILKSDSSNLLSKESSVENIDSANYDSILSLIGDSIEKTIEVKKVIQKVVLKNVPKYPEFVFVQVYDQDGTHSIKSDQFTIQKNSIEFKESALNHFENIEKIVVNYKVILN